MNRQYTYCGWIAKVGIRAILAKLGVESRLQAGIVACLELIRFHKWRRHLRDMVQHQRPVVPGRATPKIS